MPETMKWLEFEFNVYDIPQKWSDAPGVYIFTKYIASKDKHEPLYVGRTDSFSTRLVKSHEKWKGAVKLGVTHIQALTVPDEAKRKAIEALLIEDLDPPLNRT